MNRAALAIAVLLVLSRGSVAYAWDPDRDPEVVEPPAPWAPEPVGVAPPAGIYLVTETYVADVVVHSGALTTYATETTVETTGSYARVLETVPTGAASEYDGSAFNGRAALTDGRSVAGTYYENYVRTEDGFLPVSVVFFQDDSEVARAARDIVGAPSAPSLVAAPSAPAAVGEAPLSTFPATSPLPAPAIGTTAPVIERADLPPLTPAAPRRNAHVSDRSVEVLRGRRTAMSFAAPDVARWRFLSGEGVALGPVAGSSAEPFLMRWDVLAPPAAAWVLRFAIEYDDGTSGDLSVRVVVRAPALVQ